MKALSQELQSKYPYILGCLVIILVFLGLALSPKGKELTDQSYDIVRTTPSRNEAVIIAIDDKSLQAFGAWPWNREVFAHLNEKVSSYHAKSLLYDVLFLEPRAGDDVFKKSLAESTIPIALAAKLENGRYLSSYLAASSTYAALVNVSPDNDGKVRKYALPSKLDKGCIEDLSSLGFALATFKKQVSCTDELQTSMFRYPAGITTYSLSDVVLGKIPEKNFLGKTVFVGATSLDLLDTFVGMQGEKISGVSVHASMFVSKLNSVHDRKLTDLELILFIIFVGGLGGLLFCLAKTLVRQITALIGVTIFIIVLAAVLFSKGLLIPWPLSIAMVLLLAGYLTLFNIIEEKRINAQVENLFSKYVHKDVLKELMKSPTSINLQGEKRDLTILFSDLRGFTTISEKMEPEKLTSLLNDYLSAMTPCVLTEKGTIDKFIGDAVMAFWNAPLSVDDHPTKAVRSALMMERALEEFNKTHDTPLAVGIGIHRGNVIVGNVGSVDRVNYTILGDAVNLASRIEGLTKKYGVTCIVTDSVRDSVSDPSVLFRKLDIITVKGKTEPTILYEAMSHSEHKEKVIKHYEQAFGFYQKGEFASAEKLFTSLLDGGDKPSRTMLERIPLLKQQEYWDGVWHFDEK